jgi:2-polyprenyl-3-methyl-5-hydroxy-6-metoxy-1,4-benzoquinol methylase
MSVPVYPETRPLPRGAAPLPSENVYGHVQRLDWFAEHLSPADHVLEFGSGTGYMITYPMRVRGYDVHGVDIDATSIEYGQGLLERAGLDPSVLNAMDLRDLDGTWDAVIASEVFEHLDDAALAESLRLIRSKLRPGGKLLVTTPNGWGWFELEALIWNRLGVGSLLQRRAARGAAGGVLAKTKRRVTNEYVADALPSTLAQSPHVQRFTLGSIQRVVAAHGFQVVQARGSVLACGPLTDLIFTGMPRAMSYNRRLGRRFPRIASGFYVAAIRR